VIWFDAEKGMGFIKPGKAVPHGKGWKAQNRKGEDLFVHKTDVEKAGLAEGFEKGLRVQFRVARRKTGRKGDKTERDVAVDLKAGELERCETLAQHAEDGGEEGWTGWEDEDEDEPAPVYNRGDAGDSPSENSQLSDSGAPSLDAGHELVRLPPPPPGPPPAREGKVVEAVGAGNVADFQKGASTLPTCGACAWPAACKHCDDLLKLQLHQCDPALPLAPAMAPRGIAGEPEPEPYENFAESNDADRIRGILQEVGLVHHLDCLLENSFDIESLQLCVEQDWIDIGIPPDDGAQILTQFQRGIADEPWQQVPESVVSPTQPNGVPHHNLDELALCDAVDPEEIKASNSRLAAVAQSHFSTQWSGKADVLPPDAVEPRLAGTDVLAPDASAENTDENLFSDHMMQMQMQTEMDGRIQTQEELVTGFLKVSLTGLAHIARPGPAF
jgi:cold shock CspA family protein